MRYFDNTRMQAVGIDNSTKLSAFLAVGALSPRMVYDEVMRCAPAIDHAQRSAALRQNAVCAEHACSVAAWQSQS
jgi:deoxyribodipyrimidine photolyase